MDDNPYLRRRTQHKIGASGRKSETRVAKDLGGKSRPASGAMVGAKGDTDLGRVLLESKSSTNASMSVKHDWLAKISMEARQEGKSPALSVTFITGDGQPVKDGAWVMIPEYLFRELFGQREE